MRMHALNRTSPKGQPFVGTCSQCGKKNVTLEQMGSEECPNIRNISEDEALLEAIHSPTSAAEDRGDG